MSNAITLRVRKDPQSNWIENFSNWGWKVRTNGNSSWFQLTPANTKVRSADNTSWLPVK